MLFAAPKQQQQRNSVNLLSQILENMQPTLSCCALLLCTAAAVLAVDAEVKGHWDYIVIGAGPAGLQLGYYLQMAGRDYVVLEKSNISGKLCYNCECTSASVVYKIVVMHVNGIVLSTMLFFW